MQFLRLTLRLPEDLSPNYVFIHICIYYVYILYVCVCVIRVEVVRYKISAAELKWLLRQTV